VTEDKTLFLTVLKQKMVDQLPGKNPVSLTELGEVETRWQNSFEIFHGRRRTFFGYVLPFSAGFVRRLRPGSTRCVQRGLHFMNER